LPELAFAMSVASLSGGLAGLAGLVAGLRRGAAAQPLDSLRLREIVEFAFANILLALSVQPLAIIFGSLEAALRVAGAIAFVYVLLQAVVLRRRTQRPGLEFRGSWAIVAIGLRSTAMVLSVLIVLTGSIALFDLLLIVLLARPMAAFLLVLASMEMP
jgi:hypothetical protein